MTQRVVARRGMRSSETGWSHALGPRRVLILCAASIALPLALVLSLIARTGDVSILNYFGSDGPSSAFVRASYPGALFPDPVGHDGSAFYVISRTFPNLDRAAANLDDPSYRLRRILVPALLRPFSGRAYTVALLLLTLAAVAAGAVFLAILLERGGLPWWLGISFGLSPGILFATRFGLTDVIALSLALGGLVIIQRRPVIGAIALTAAALTRETALIAAAAAFLTMPGARRYMLIPFGITVTWLVWVSQSYPKGDHPLIAAPFSAWFSHGLGAGILAIVVFCGSVAGAWALRRRARPLAWLFVGEALLLIVMASPNFFGGNFLRVVPLSVVGMLVLLVTRARRDTAETS